MVPALSGSGCRESEVSVEVIEGMRHFNVSNDNTTITPVSHALAYALPMSGTICIAISGSILVGLTPFL